jgi:hypothetical protein
VEREVREREQKEDRKERKIDRRLDTEEELLNNS